MLIPATARPEPFSTGTPTLTVTGNCPYSRQEVQQILTGFSLSLCKALKEVPGFVDGAFDRDAAFRKAIGDAKATF